MVPSKHDTLNQCWVNVGRRLRRRPTLAQHWFNVSCLLAIHSLLVSLLQGAGVSPAQLALLLLFRRLSVAPRLGRLRLPRRPGHMHLVACIQTLRSPLPPPSPPAAAVLSSAVKKNRNK